MHNIGCVLLGVLGDERRDLRLSDDAVVKSDDLGVGVDNGSGDAVERAVFEILHLVGESKVSHGHLLVCAFGLRIEQRGQGGETQRHRGGSKCEQK